MMPDYYVCPSCGFKQKSQAEKRIRCHRCGRSYRKADAKKDDKQPDDDAGTGFVTFSAEQNGEEDQ